MIKAAVIEDKDKDAEQLSACLQNYKKEKNEEIDIIRYKNAKNFLENYRSDYDIVFFDIELPGLSGMEAAKSLRKLDDNVIIIFVTNMAQFAVKGYEVDALDYIVKPVKYQKLLFVLQKAVNIIEAGRDAELLVMQRGSVARISTKELYYIEVRGHKLSYFTNSGTIEGFGSLSELERSLNSRHFMRCNSCYLVNPRFITFVKGLDIVMRNGITLKISQPKRRQFMNELTNYLGQGKL